MKAVIRYLKYTVNHGISYHSGQPRPPTMIVMNGYGDARARGDMADRKSTPGFIICYNGGPIRWVSEKRTMVAMSTAGTENKYLPSAAQQLQAMRRLCMESGLTAAAPCLLKTDNLAVVEMLANPYGTKRRELIDLRHHLLQQIIHIQALQVLHVRDVHQKEGL